MLEQAEGLLFFYFVKANVFTKSVYCDRLMERFITINLMQVLSLKSMDTEIEYDYLIC